MAWTDKMVEDLKIMWKQGLTTGEIGKRLGVSKNSIVGKVHRLQLDARPSPIRKKTKKRQKPRLKTTPKKHRQPSSKQSENLPATKERPMRQHCPQIRAFALLRPRTLLRGMLN